MSPQDCSLVHQARAGDARAFGRLAVRYQPLVYREIRRYLQHNDEVEDLVQDVFCKAFQQIGGLRKTQLFPAWLRRTAANAALSWGRTRQRHMRLQDEVIASQLSLNPIQSPETSFERQQNAEELMRCLQGLPTKERRAMLLYYSENCNYDQIAQCMGVSSASVKLYLRKGRNRLLARWRKKQLLPV